MGSNGCAECCRPCRTNYTFHNLGAILDAAAKGSVITNDHAVKILTILAATPAYSDDCLTLLLDQLKDAPVNQLPTYAESAATIVTPNYKPEMARMLTERLPEITQDAKYKRLTNVLQKLQK